MGLGAAVAGAAALGVAGSVGASMIQSNAAKKASQQQAQASANALATQQQMFGVAQNALSPYYNAGASTLPTLQSLLTPGLSQTNTLSGLPGFQFQSQWGTMSAKNALAAEGLGGSTGPLAKAISDYNNGLAGSYYNNYVGQLQNFVNTGAGAASALASGAIGAGNAMASTQQSQGNALAAGTLGSSNALAGGISGVGSSAANALLLNSLLGNKSSQGIYGGGSLFGVGGLGA